MVKPKHKQLREAQEDKIKKPCTKLWEDQQAGNTPNIRRTATYYGVPWSTLRDRFLGAHKPANEAHKHQQLLTEHQEKVLVDWIEHFDAGRYISYGHIIMVALVAQFTQRQISTLLNYDFKLHRKSVIMQSAKTV